jgi:hypothetical protein
MRLNLAHLLGHHLRLCSILRCILRVQAGLLAVRTVATGPADWSVAIAPYLSRTAGLACGRDLSTLLWSRQITRTWTGQRSSRFRSRGVSRVAAIVGICGFFHNCAGMNLWGPGEDKKKCRTAKYGVLNGYGRSLRRCNVGTSRMSRNVAGIFPLFRNPNTTNAGSI